MYSCVCVCVDVCVCVHTCIRVRVLISSHCLVIKFTRKSSYSTNTLLSPVLSRQQIARVKVQETKELVARALMSSFQLIHWFPVIQLAFHVPLIHSNPPESSLGIQGGSNHIRRVSVHSLFPSPFSFVFFFFFWNLRISLKFLVLVWMECKAIVAHTVGRLFFKNWCEG